MIEKDSKNCHLGQYVKGPFKISCYVILETRSREGLLGFEMILGLLWVAILWWTVMQGRWKLTVRMSVSLSGGACRKEYHCQRMVYERLTFSAKNDE